MAQTVTKEAQHLTLKDSIKVNQDVSTDDDIHITEDPIGDQVVIRKHDVALEPIMDSGIFILRVIILPE